MTEAQIDAVLAYLWIEPTGWSLYKTADGLCIACWHPMEIAG